jgi:hypothetical protein
MDLAIPPCTANAKNTYEQQREEADRMTSQSRTGDRFVVVRPPVPTEEEERAQRRGEKLALVLGGLSFILFLLVLVIMIRHMVYIWTE